MLPKPRHAGRTAAAARPSTPPAAGRHPAARAGGDPWCAARRAGAGRPPAHRVAVSFGLMDFVSAHRGAIPQSAMGVQGQFEHPLVVRAKLEIAAACHAEGKVPSHCVVTEFKHTGGAAGGGRRWLRGASATRACGASTRRRSAPSSTPSHPAWPRSTRRSRSCRPRRPRTGRPSATTTRLHDRASYRYFWQLLERAHRTSYSRRTAAAGEVRAAWFGETGTQGHEAGHRRHGPALVLPTFEGVRELRTRRTLLRNWQSTTTSNPGCEMNADPAGAAPLFRRRARRATRRWPRPGACASTWRAAAGAPWALDIPGVMPFAGFVGLIVPAWRRTLHAGGRDRLAAAAQRLGPGLGQRSGGRRRGLRLGPCWASTNWWPSRCPATSLAPRHVTASACVHDTSGDFAHPRFPPSTR
jgi:hypothetical protein